jgi:hypothetical protein
MLFENNAEMSRVFRDFREAGYVRKDHTRKGSASRSSATVRRTLKIIGKSATCAVSILFLGRISKSICPVAFYPPWAHGSPLLRSKKATVDLIVRGRQDEILALSFSV